MNSSIFREYDIRGVAGKDLSAELATNLGKAYAHLARERLGKQELRVSVGRDVRLTGEEYSAALIKGLRAAGVNVISLGQVTTPMTYFSIHHLKLDGAIMVTGSHNPPEYNGFKICIGKGTLHGSEIQELRKIMEKNAPAGAIREGSSEHLNIFPAYLDFILKDVKLKRPLKIVVDAGNGAASNFAPEIFRKLGCDVTELFCTPDGRFPNHPADPTVESNLQDVIAAVTETGADAGIAFDGDADRIGVVNEKGGILWGDELMIVLSRAVLKARPGATIISEVKSSYRLYNDIEKHGGKGIMWKTGHSLIKAKMKETGAALAGEMSGHIFFADRFFGFDDAIYAGARFLEILADSSGKTSDLLSGVPTTVNTPEIRIECDDDKKWDVIEKIRDSLSKKYKTNQIDGVRVEFGDAWGLVRASNTQPVIVMRFEAQTPARLKEVRTIIENEARQAGLKV
ncbi:MAG: phosphomannomutase/phosphoglucomutase [Bdellovibrionota bacterium]